MKFKSILAAALVGVVAFSSCSKEDNTGGGNVNGDGAKMSVSFTLPLGAETRASGLQGTQQATDKECTVSNLSVYIFDGNGNVASTGGFTRYNSADLATNGSGKFTVTPSTAPGANEATYTLKTGNEIETLAGTGMSFYIVINMPAKYTGSFATEAQFLDAYETVVNMSQDDNFTMFGKKTNLELKPEDDPSLVADNGINKAKIEMERVVSKVVASYGSQTYTVPNNGTPFTESGMLLTYTIKEFNVYNEAIESYIPKKATTLSTLNSFANGKLKANQPVVAHPLDEAARKPMTNKFYIGENIPNTNASTPGTINTLNGNTTYAMIATTVEVDIAADYDTTAEEMIYESATYGGGTSDVLMVKYGIQCYVTDNLSKASRIKAYLDAIDPAIEANIYTYTKGWVHFQTYLSKYGTNDYQVNRNEFIHIMITGIKDFQEGEFPGYPGDPNEPEKPIDPTVTDPDNPDPIDPVDPVDPELAKLSIEIEVKPWNYYVHEVILD